MAGTRWTLLAITAFAVIAAGTAVMQGGRDVDAGPPLPREPMPPFHSKDPARPIAILAQKTFAPADVGNKAQRHAVERHPERPLGELTRTLAPFVLEGSGEIWLVVDYWGETREPRTESGEHGVFVTAAVGCPQVDRACLAAGSDSTQHPSMYDSSRYSDELRRNPKEGPAELIGHVARRWVLNPGVPQTIYLAIDTPPHFTTKQVRATVLRGEYSLEPPSGRAKARAWLTNWRITAMTYLGALCFLALFIVLEIRAARRYPPHDDTPRALGALIMLYGAVLAGVPLATARGEPFMYFVIAGAIWMLSGLYLFFGRKAGQWWFVVGLMVTWAWTALEFHPTERAFWTQIAFQSLIAFYILSSNVSERLEKNTA